MTKVANPHEHDDEVAEEPCTSRAADTDANESIDRQSPLKENFDQNNIP